MNKKQTRRITALFCAIVLCVSVFVPLTGLAADNLVSDATAPLQSITATTGYTLSPAFQENTRVYTLFKTTGADVTNQATFESAIAYTAFENDSTAVTYDPRLNLYEITNTNGENSTKYYISYGGTYVAGTANPTATINLLKVLQTEMGKVPDPENPGAFIDNGFADLKLDSLEFKFKLTSAGIVGSSTPASYTDTVNPLPADGATDSGDDSHGKVTVTNEDTYAEMTINKWDGANVSFVTAATQPQLAVDETLLNRPFVEGAFSIQYSAVGQYKYILEEVIPAEADQISGVNYESDYIYEVIVSVVNADPSNPDSSNLKIGWIEVKKIDPETYDGIEDTEYDTEKVNFGTEGGTDVFDGFKYDSSTTAVTYPFVNTLATDNLHISKTVTGDLGDREQEFLFKVTIRGNKLANDYAISYAKDENVTASTLHPETTKEADDGDTASVITTYFSLKNGESATIYGIPVGATYAIEELTAADGDKTVTKIEEAGNYNTTITYDSAVTGDTTKVVEQDVVVSKGLGDPTTAEGNPAILDIPVGENYLPFNAVDYVNDKPLSPPTGAFADMIPYIAIVLVAIGGFSAVVILRKRKSVYGDTAR